jgi:hypothetical protein
MLLEIDVSYYPDDYDPEEYRELGKVVTMKKGKMTINTIHVAAFNPTDTGNRVIVRLTNGEVFEGHLSYEKFGDIMYEEELTRDMFVSGDN